MSNNKAVPDTRDFFVSSCLLYYAEFLKFIKFSLNFVLSIITCLYFQPIWNSLPFPALLLIFFFFFNWSICAFNYLDFLQITTFYVSAGFGVFFAVRWKTFFFPHKLCILLGSHGLCPQCLLVISFPFSTLYSDFCGVVHSVVSSHLVVCSDVSVLLIISLSIQRPRSLSQNVLADSAIGWALAHEELN